MRTLIKNAWILTMDQQLSTYEDAMIEITDDTITYVGASDDKLLAQADHVLDAKGGIVTPGFINTHAHISMIPFRSLGDDCPDRLRRYLFPLENECMTASLVYESARYGILEMQRSGVTTVLDMYYFEDEVARACDELSMRGVLGETVINFKTCDTDKAHGGLEYGETFIKKWRQHPFITPCIAPHAPNTNDAKALQQAHELAVKYDTFVTMHVAEMDYEMAEFAEKYNMTPVEYLNSIGVLSDRLIAAHCIHVNDSDMTLLAENNVKVAHCIGSNMKAGKGIAPIKQMLEAGICVGLGTDGPSSGNTLDLFTQMKLIPYAQKTKYRDRSIFKAEDVVKLATIEGAKVLGLETLIGSIEVGKRADLVLIETESVNMFPIYDPYSALVYSANASNVSDVFINGKQVVKNKQSVHQTNQIKQALSNEMKYFKKRALESSKVL